MASKEPKSFYVQKRHFLVDIRGQLEALVKWEQSADVPDEGDLKHYVKMLRDVEDDLAALEPMVADEDDDDANSEWGGEGVWYPREERFGG